jgi:AcrR family transcriptional regulator
VGITATSIYPHFPDAQAIVQAVVVQTFAELNAFIAEAFRGMDDPRERLLAGCGAYITFGLENPNLYKLLFDRNRELGGHNPEGRPITEADLSTGAFGQLVEGVAACIAAGVSSAQSAPRTALDLWVAMHGLVSLRGGGYPMPWPPREVMEVPLVLAIARIET